MGSSYLAVGYECNHQCICCPLTTFDRLHKKIELEDIKARIEMIPLTTTNHIVLSGGEPMLHPDIFNILDYLAEKHFSITILSNSSKCKNKAFAKQFSQYNQLEIVTAIHSSSPMLHDEMTGVSGSLLETLEGLDNLVENGIPITVKHIINAKTLPTIIDTFDYLEKHFPPLVSFQFCSMDYSGRAEKNRSGLFVSRQEFVSGLENVLDLLESRMSRKRRITVIETPYCFADPYYWKYFEGSTEKLLSYIAPNIDDRDIAYEVDSACNTGYPQCQICSVQKYCSGIWSSAYMIDSTLLESIQAYE